LNALTEEIIAQIDMLCNRDIVLMSVAVPIGTGRHSEVCTKAGTAERLCQDRRCRVIRMAVKEACTGRSGTLNKAGLEKSENLRRRGRFIKALPSQPCQSLFVL